MTTTQATDELDSDFLKSLDPYLRVEAQGFADLLQRRGQAKAQEFIDSRLPTEAAAPVTVDVCMAEIKAWMARPDNKWLGDKAQAVCGVMVEALQAIKDHSKDAGKNMTHDWFASAAVRVGHWCRTEPFSKTAKTAAAKSTNSELLTGVAAAKHLLDRLQSGVAGGNVDSDVFHQLLPYTFLLNADELKVWIGVKQSHCDATGILQSPSSSSVPMKKAKLAHTAVDPHAKTWNLFAA